MAELRGPAETVAEPKGMAFSKIEPTNLPEKIMATLKEAFFAGKLKPGELIPERELARQMGCGTPGVREALIMLQEQGFVQRIANRGTYVTKFSHEEVEQLYRFRTELELIALRWAKPRATEQDLSVLERIVKDMTHAAQERDAPTFFERDLAFHRQCWSLANHRFLYRSLETIVGPLFAFVLVDNRSTVNETVAREHLNIINALRNLQEPDFSSVIRDTLNGFAFKGLASMFEIGRGAAPSK